jgi:hypothetical protein
MSHKKLEPLPISRIGAAFEQQGSAGGYLDHTYVEERHIPYSKLFPAAMRSANHLALASNEDVSQLIEYGRFWDIDFETGFETLKSP